MRKYKKFAAGAFIGLLVALGAGGRVLAAATADVSAPEKSPAITVLETQNKRSARLTFTMDKAPNLKLRRVKDGVEVLSEGNGGFKLDTLASLREIAGVEFRTEGKTEIALIRFAADCCQVQEHRVGHAYKLDFISRRPGEDPPKPAAQAAKPDPAAKPPPKTAQAKAPTQTKGASAPAKDKSELGDLRSELMGRLAQLNAPLSNSPVSGATSPAGAADRTAAQTPTAAPKPSCAAAFKIDGWGGAQPFADNLRQLRAATAEAKESPSALATLAEFYIAHGLGGEALAVTQEARLDGVPDAERSRVQRDADLGRLLRGTPIATTSVLLNSPPDCEPADVPLWRTLSAAASGDKETVRRDAAGAAHMLALLPESLANRLAQVPGIRLVNNGFFNEFCLRLPISAAQAVDALAAKGVLGGVPLSRFFPERDDLADVLLVAATETVTADDIETYAQRLAEVLR